MKSFSFILWVGKDEKILPPKSDFDLFRVRKTWSSNILQWRMKMLCRVQKVLICKADWGWCFSSEKDQRLLRKKEINQIFTFIFTYTAMLTKNILKAAKKIMWKRLDRIEWSLYYNVQKNQICITDSLILVEIQLPEEYKGKIDWVSQISVDYYTVCALLDLLSDWYFEFYNVSKWKSHQDYVEFKMVEDKTKANSRNDWIYRFPMYEFSQTLPPYKEESLFENKEDKAPNIYLSDNFKLFQEVCQIITGLSPTATVRDQTFTVERDLDLWYYKYGKCRICTRRVIS